MISQRDGQTSDSMTTFGPGDHQPPNQSTLFAVDSPVRTSVTQDSEKESQASGQAYGRKSRGSLATYNHDSSSWRTSQRCLDGEWEEFSGTWPRSGTMQNGNAYRRRPLVRITDAIEYSSLSIVPTPSACDHKGSGRPRKGRGPGNNLRDWFRQTYGFLYPPVRVVEYLMGFEIGNTCCTPSETQSSRKSPNGSAGE
jgi:hypothetical protein